MTLSLEGVSDLYTSQDLDQVLREGILILGNLAACWPVAQNYSKLLDSIIVNANR